MTPAPVQAGKLPAGVDPENVPLAVAAAMLGRRDLDVLATRIPTHTLGPAGRGVKRFTTLAAIKSMRQPHPAAPMLQRLVVARDVKRARRLLA